LAAGDLTKEDIRLMAYDKADATIAKRFDNLRSAGDKAQEFQDEIQQYRGVQERNYRSLYEWNSANDETSLKNILDNECQIFEIDSRLSKLDLTSTDRDKLMDRHSKLIELHAKLLLSAGIDRVSREKKRETAGPMEDWILIKRKAALHMERMKSEFPDEAAKAKSEIELRDAIKHHLGMPFGGIIDVILREHRRVLGLPKDIDTDA
jgi:hypothetical protein